MRRHLLYVAVMSACLCGSGIWMIIAALRAVARFGQGSLLLTACRKKGLTCNALRRIEGGTRHVGRKECSVHSRGYSTGHLCWTSSLYMYSPGALNDVRVCVRFDTLSSQWYGRQLKRGPRITSE